MKEGREEEREELKGRGEEEKMRGRSKEKRR